MERVFLKAINEWFKDNPAGMIIAGIVFYSCWKGIPWLIKYFRKEKEKESTAREETRRDIKGIVNTLDSHTEKMNGHAKQLKFMENTMNGHVRDKDIHVPRREIVTEKTCRLKMQPVISDVERIKAKVFNGEH